MHLYRHPMQLQFWCGSPWNIPVHKMMFSGLKKTGITQNGNNGLKKRERHQEVRGLCVAYSFNTNISLDICDSLILSSI